MVAPLEFSTTTTRNTIQGISPVSGSIPDGGSIAALNPFLLEVKFTHFSGSIPDGGSKRLYSILMTLWEN